MKKIMLLGLAALLSVGSINSAFAQQEPKCKKECCKKCDAECKQKCSKEDCTKKCDNSKSCNKEIAKA
jgi:hypothetical protein